ncbi:hypothetical protein [Acetobacter oeni]|uniref:Uncharacterized protein n=1 Tax=Acetobacter oeni TaxID=304077 RepID=A0A511XQR9_9PROT|nr:hypothetical protein [Acetobacter oeni]MBB3884863.1 hypothetical protein [Acetobacter oeni]NHO20719.1 hypothetical protein [Acetobacter oeni]GEN65274.1 hypothetical protein AOE01nite_34980 [Acetobacter oeni]
MTSHHRLTALLHRRTPGERAVIRRAHSGYTAIRSTLSQHGRIRRTDMTPAWGYGLTPTHPAPRSTM